MSMVYESTTGKWISIDTDCVGVGVGVHHMSYSLPLFRSCIALLCSLRMRDPAKISFSDDTFEKRPGLENPEENHSMSSVPPSSVSASSRVDYRIRSPPRPHTPLDDFRPLNDPNTPDDAMSTFTHDLAVSLPYRASSDSDLGKERVGISQHSMHATSMDSQRSQASPIDVMVARTISRVFNF